MNRLNDNMNKFVDIVSFNQYVGWFRDVSDKGEKKKAFFVLRNWYEKR